MDLDEDALKAVEKLVRHSGCKVWLQNPDQADNKHNLKYFLYDHTDADLMDHPAIIAEARKRVFTPGGIDEAASTSSARSRPTRREAFDEKLITSPFRFIDIPDQVVMPPKGPPVARDYPAPGRFCGTIDYQLVAETPLLIGGAGKPRPDNAQDNPAVEPLRLGASGSYAIPGATMRGLIRSACEIVGYGKLQQGNWHHRYGVRDFTHEYYQSQSVSKVALVRAGFLHVRAATDKDNASVINDDGEVFELTPARSWAHVPVESLNDIGIDARTISDRNHDQGKIWTNFDLDEKYRKAGMDGFNFSVTTGFKKVAASQYIDNIMAPVLEGGQQGVLVFAGAFPGKGNKKYEYAFFPNADNKPIALPCDRVNLFVAMYSDPSKNKSEPSGNWKTLKPVAKVTFIPVFYVGNPKSNSSAFFFGLTRLFKIPHRRSVRDVIEDSQRQHLPKGAFEYIKGDTNDPPKYKLKKYEDDFVERLFGYVVEPKDLKQTDGEGNPLVLKKGESIDPAAIALKGRVAFGFLTLDKATPARVEKPVTTVQMGPRASFAPFYLRSNNPDIAEKDYSAGEVRLAGRKAYFPRYQSPDVKKALNAITNIGAQQIAEIKKASKGRSDGRKTWSHLRFLVPANDRPLVFAGQIRLHNVTPEEIGLVLFALTHGGDSERKFRHMIGRAKPFGAGQMRLGAVTLNLESNTSDNGPIEPQAGDEAFDQNTGKEVGRDGSNGTGLAPFLARFESWMKQHDKSYPNVAPVEEWLGMCDPRQGEKAAATLVYQPLSSFRKIRDMFKTLPAGSPKPENRPRLLPAPRSKR